MEARMQNELRTLLSQRYGESAVEAEGNYADLRVKRSPKDIVIEIKSSTRARLAIRHAIGQLLEYSFFRLPGRQARLMVIVRGSGFFRPIGR